MVGVAPPPATVSSRDPRDRGGPLQPLLLVRHLQKHFKIHGGLLGGSGSRVHAVDDVDAIYDDPRHPYTRALLAAMPSMDPDQRTMEAPLFGDPPNPIDPPSGCRFRTRCAFAEAVCEETEPALIP